MRLLPTVAALSLALASAAHAQTAAPAPAPAQTPAAGRVSARLPITPQPSADQRLERLEAALTDVDTQLRGLKAQSESLTGLTPEQSARLQETLDRLDRTQASLTATLKTAAPAPAR